MEHKYIDESDLVERYLRGRLAAEETAEFEAHFVDCLECVGQLKTTKALIDGLRIVASEQAPEPRVDESIGFSWWLRATSFRWSPALVAGVLLLVALVGAGLVFNQILRSRVEADQAKSASAEWERRYEEEREASSLAEMRRQNSERELTTQLAQLRAELNDRRKTTEERADDHGALKKPQINFKTHVLTATRGSEPIGGLKELVLSRSPSNFSISVPLEAEKPYKVYGMTLRDRTRTVWKSSRLTPDGYNSLSVEFNTGFFRDGNYSLRVEGIAGDGSTNIIGEYFFRVLKKFN